MKRFLYATFSMSLLSSCSASLFKNGCETYSDIYEIINLHFNNDRPNGQIYYKAYSENWEEYLNYDIVINQINHQEYKKLIKLHDSLLQNPLLTAFQIDSIKNSINSRIHVGVESFLTPDDIKYLAHQIIQTKPISWKKRCLNGVILSKKEEVVKSPSPIFKEKKNKAFSKKPITKLSVPIFTEDRKNALLFVAGSYSDHLFFYRKDHHNNWVFFCSATLRIE